MSEPKKFIVFVREVYVQQVLVEAESENEAIKKVRFGEGDHLDNSLEYSHTLDSDTWTAEEDS